MTITAKCSCCGRTENYKLTITEAETLTQYRILGRGLGKLQDLFPSVPAWIRSGAIDKTTGGFCICPECGRGE